MKKLLMLGLLAGLVMGIGVENAQAAPPIFRTLTIPAITTYGTLWDTLGSAKATSQFTFPVLPNNVESGYLITIFPDDTSGSPDSVQFFLQRNIPGADEGVMGATNGPGATTDIGAGEWLMCGARLGAAYLGFNNAGPLTKYIPADSLIAYPIIPGSNFRIIAVGGKAEADHFTASAKPYVFNIYIESTPYEPGR